MAAFGRSSLLLMLVQWLMLMLIFLLLLFLLPFGILDFHRGLRLHPLARHRV